MYSLCTTRIVLDAHACNCGRRHRPPFPLGHPVGRATMPHRGPQSPIHVHCSGSRRAALPLVQRGGGGFARARPRLLAHSLLRTRSPRRMRSLLLPRSVSAIRVLVDNNKNNMYARARTPLPHLTKLQLVYNNRYRAFFIFFIIIIEIKNE